MDRERILSLWAGLAGGGGLAPEDEGALLEALERDPALRAELLDDEAVDGLLRSSIDAPRDAEEFTREVADRLAAERDASRFVQAVRDKVHAEATAFGAGAAAPRKTGPFSWRRRSGGILRGGRARGTSWIRYGLPSAGVAAALLVTIHLMGSEEIRKVGRDAREARHEPAPRRAGPERAQEESDQPTERETAVAESEVPLVVTPRPSVAREATMPSPTVEETGRPAPAEERQVAEGPGALAAPEREKAPVGAHVAYVDSLEGTVESARADADGWAPASAGSPLFAGERVRTLFSRVRIAFETGSVLYANRFTTFTLSSEPRPQGLELVGGEVYVETVGADKGFWVGTPHGRAVDLGTRFGVEAKPNRTTIVVVEGEVEASTSRGSARVPEDHEMLMVRGVGAPGRVRRAHDLDKRLAWLIRLGRVAVVRRPPMHIDPRRTETQGKGKWRVLSRTATSVKTPFGGGLEANSYFLFGTPDWKDYRIRSRVRLVEIYGSTFGVGVVGYWQEPGRSFRARFMGYKNGGQWRLTRGCAAAGNDRSLARSEGTLLAGDEIWFLLELRTEDDNALLRAKVWPAGAQEPREWRLSARAAQDGPTQGRAGFWAFHCEAAFSETSVRPLPPTDSEDGVQR